jgi:hypothetical protein
MRNCLTILLNIVFKEDLELLYGKGTLVEINTAKPCTTTKEYLIDCTLKIGDPSLLEEVKLDGLMFLLNESWKFTGSDRTQLRVNTNFDVIN